MFLGFHLLFLLLLAVKRTGQIQFTSRYQRSDVTALIGSTVNFTWGFTKGFGGVAGVTWGLPDSSLNDLNNSGFLVSLDGSGNLVSVSVPSDYSGRVSGRIVGDKFNGQAIFSLNFIKKSDGRLYGCKLFPENSFDSTQFDTVTLVVEGPPSIIETSGNQTVNVGDNLLLNCTADGTPKPTYTWTRLSDNKEVTMPLTISKQSEGGYRCTAGNGIGNPATADVFIIVQYKPSGVTIRTSAAQNTAIQGQNVTLTCHVTEAKPPVSAYRFYRNGSLLTPTTNVNKFIIRKARRSQHFGEYKCEAHNAAGDEQSGTVVLNINVPAEIQSVTANITVNEGSAVELRCDVTGYPSPTITWKKDGQQKSSGSSLLRIPSSTRSDSGAYVCTAVNVVRRAEKQTFVTVRYKATITAHAASAAKSWIGQTVKLTCEADGLPTPTITWKKPNGNKVKEVTATQNTADAEMQTDHDFGSYTCEAKNVVGPAATRTVEIRQIKEPGEPNIVSEDKDIQAQSLTVKWTAPADDGGSPITAYRVVILKSGQVIRNENITKLNAPKEMSIGSLNISTNYTVRVYARNFVFEGDAGEKMVRTKFEGVPAAAEILGLPRETSDPNITVSWSEPENNGKSITQYEVYQRTLREDGTPREWSRLYVTTNPSVRQVAVQLEKGKVYEFVVTATNEFGESLKEEKKIKKITVLGGVPLAVKLTAELNEDKITLTWKEPDNNGATITKYSVYQRLANDEEWKRLENITDVSIREYVVQVGRGKKFEFVVTASNKYGESPKGDFNSVTVSAGKIPSPDPPAGRVGIAVIAGVAAAGVLVILGLILFVVWWKRRKTSSDGGSSEADLRRNNLDDFDDGYSAVGATRQLQASGAVADVTYAEVDKSGKRNRQQVTDVYSEVDKSKKNKKKPKKKPGELDYAELDDLRPNSRPAPQPRPLVRPPAYEGTLYADIAQFGVPQPEPTYDNVPKKDVVYSNVESM